MRMPFDNECDRRSTGRETFARVFDRADGQRCSFSPEPGRRPRGGGSTHIVTLKLTDFLAGFTERGPLRFDDLDGTVTEFHAADEGVKQVQDS